jgi:circadian clock protein KaiC
MSQTEPDSHIEKVPTGIPGFDMIAKGGLPIDRTTLVSGTTGSGKSVFASQFLAEGIKQYGQPGVFVTFEEAPRDIRLNMKGLGADIPAWEEAGQWAFVDGSPHLDETTIVVGEYDLGALLARIRHAVEKTSAKRVAVDSIGSIFSQFKDHSIIRRELYRISAELREMGVTSIITAERDDEYGPIARHQVEEFVADNVIVLRNMLAVDERHRTIELLKMRGTDHQKGEYPFTIISGRGAIIVPLSAIEINQPSSTRRITSGNAPLDEMCGGGFFSDATLLVSGATGTGKTLMAIEFMASGVEQGERCLMLSFEESREQIFRNAAGWGIDFEEMGETGHLRLMCVYPEALGLEDHLIHIKDLIDTYQPHRIAVDSLSALSRVGSERAFREFIIGLTAFIKESGAAGLLTTTTPELMGSKSVTDNHVSTIADSIVLLRYVEMDGVIKRGIAVLKMRGSKHDKHIRELTIDGDGMHIGEPLYQVAGIIAGRPHVTPDM